MAWHIAFGTIVIEVCHVLTLWQTYSDLTSSFKEPRFYELLCCWNDRVCFENNNISIIKKHEVQTSIRQL